MTNIQNPRAKTQKGFTPLEVIGQELSGGTNKPLTGFTLIEFLVIISIIGILAAISVPALKKYQSNLQLNGATRNLVSDLRYAQQLAVTEQIEYCVCFFPLDDKYKIIRCRKSDPPDPQCGDTGLVLIKEVSLRGENIDLTSTVTEIRYNPYGAVKETGTITLDGEKIIDVKPSGFVKITD